MGLSTEIVNYINQQPAPKSYEMEQLHQMILQIAPGCKLWFHSGKDDKGKVVSNPAIGYGHFTIKYTDGKTRDFFRIGISANQAGISVYIMGLKDKAHLVNTYGNSLGKAKVTGYCIKFKSLNDINIDVLQTAIREALNLSDC